MPIVNLPSYGNSDTLPKKDSRLQSQLQPQSHISRAGLVYGTSFSRGSCSDGVRRFAADNEDMWFDAERFQLDHINEVLTKLNDGSLDDEIWGKIVVMERGKRIAKAYLRKTTVIVDGGDEEFDGKTLGFNFFTNPMRDEYTKELRSKISDGVIIKMDNQGNIKAMARGSTPVFVQGWKDSKTHCISDKVIRNHGKLITKSATSVQSDEDRVVKIFDMRRFKQAVERDPYETDTDARNLLLKSCVRVALVKDGGAADPMKTPCWFMIINLVALDMLKTKLPSVCTSSILSANHSGIPESSRLSRIMSQVSIVPPASNADLYSNPALTQLLAAAMQQANNQHYAGNMSGKLAASSSAMHMEQIAKLASTLSLANPMGSTYQSAPRRIRRSRSFSDSEDSEMDTKRTTAKPMANYSGSTTGSSSGIVDLGKDRIDLAPTFGIIWPSPWTLCMNHERRIPRRTPRTRSWSSNSRVSSKEDEPRSYSPSIPSDAEHCDLRRSSAPQHEIANAADRPQHASTVRAVSPKPVVQPSATELDQPPLLENRTPSLTRTAVCPPMQRGPHFAKTASDNVLDKSVGDSNSRSSNDSSPSPNPFPKRSIITTPPKDQFRESQREQSTSRERRGSSTDSAASDAPFEAKPSQPTQQLYRQPPFGGRQPIQESQLMRDTSLLKTPLPPKTAIPTTAAQELSLPESPPTLRRGLPLRAISQSGLKPQPPSENPSEIRVYDARSLRPWKKPSEPPPPPTSKLPITAGAAATRTEFRPSGEYSRRSGTYNPQKLDSFTPQPEIQRRTSNKESRNAMSNEQPSLRERVWGAQAPSFNPTMAPTIQRWLGSESQQSQSLGPNHSNLTSKAPPPAATTSSTWRHRRSGPWDELVGPSPREEQQRSTHLGLETPPPLSASRPRSQIPTISDPSNSSSNTPAAPTPNVRSLQHYYEQQHQKQYDWRLRESTPSTPEGLTPRMKRLQSQQFYHHSQHRSMDATTGLAKAVPNRYSQAPLPPQRLASIVHPHHRPTTTTSYCIN